MKKLAAIASLLMLSSCTSTAPVIGSKIYFVLQIRQPDVPNLRWVVAKNIPLADKSCNGYHKYFIVGSHCYMVPEDNIPNIIEIDYLHWLTTKENENRGFSVGSSANIELSNARRRAAHARRDAAIDQLPPSAWRKITIKPKELVAKYQHRMPNGSPESYLIPQSRAREVWVTVEIMPDDTVKISERYKWRYGASSIYNWR